MNAWITVDRNTKETCCRMSALLVGFGITGASVPDTAMENSSVREYCENRKVALSLPDDTQHPHTASQTG